MYKNLRIVFCILSVICAAAAVFVLIYDWRFGIGVVLLALAFAGLMFLFKNLQTREELKKNPPPARGDYLTGRIEPEKEADTKQDKADNK